MVLTRKDLSLSPTQHGVLFLGILAAMLLGSINYNNNAGFILVFLLGSMALISLFISVKNLVGLRVFPGSPAAVFAGQTAVFPVRIQAGETQGQALHLYFNRKDQEIQPKGKDPIEVPLETRSRGYLVPGALILESVFPLGLFRLRARIPITTGVLVYPRPLAGTVSDLGPGLSGQGEESGQSLGPDDFQGLSPYVPGSPMGHISWKTLSRGKGLFIKNFTADAGQNLIFDLEKIRGEDLEKKLALLCRAVLDAQAQHLAFGLRLGPSRLINPGSGSAHLHTCLSALALFGSPEAR